MMCLRSRRSLAKIKKFSQCWLTDGLKYCDSRTYCQKVSEKIEEKYVSFMEMIKMRRCQASNSILVQVQSAQSYKELSTYCNSLGQVKNMFHYSEGAEPMHFILVEFASDQDVKNILESSTHLLENQTVPASSQFLWFRAANKKLAKLKQNKQVKLCCLNGTNIMSNIDLSNSLSKCKSISDQISELYNLTKLNDLGLRLRFLTARQVESTVSGVFPNVCAYPFGSSVNGFGKMGCDLDIVMRFNENLENESSRLVFHCKAGSGSERSTSQRNMEVVGDLINLFLPGCSQVRRILQAKVPIIKYHQHLTNIECDLSMTNMSGVYMSDFLYMMGEIDWRVRPLVFAIRRWAKEVYLTNSSPGRWITNFSLTLLVLAFLQKPLSSPPVLPTLNELTKSAGPNDQFITEDGVNCTFLRDITKLKATNKNTNTLESLLLEFFEFYAQFDFTNKAICLNEAVSITKPEHSAMYIVNPLERSLNVSKNVSVDELERFKVEVRNAAWILESQEGKLVEKGLLAILDNKRDIREKINVTFSPKYNRLMDITTLFAENPAEQVEYKNNQVKAQVDSIKKETKENIKMLEVKHRRQKTGR